MRGGGRAELVSLPLKGRAWNLPMNRWYGKILGLLAGAALFRPNPLVGALIGLLIGHAFDADWFRGPRENPWRVLGLTDEASDAEVDLAYRRLITQYHPDKLSGAADELRRQAAARAREINTASDRIDRTRVVKGTSVSVRVDHGVPRRIK